MERKVVVVCSVVGFLGVLSAALGFAAEGTRVKVRPAAPPPLSLSRSPAAVDAPPCRAFRSWLLAFASLRFRVLDLGG
jgi:hypothetical protein